MPPSTLEPANSATPTVAKLLHALGDLRRTWPQLMLCQLLSSSVMVVLIGPLIGALFMLFLAREEDGVLTDTEIVTYLFDPVTFGAALLIGAVSIGVAFGRMSMLLVIGFGATEDRRVTYMDALRYVLARASQFQQLAGNMIIRLLLVALPFLGATAGLYPLLLAEHDINYYLTDHPPEFWRAAGLGAVILTVGAALILRLAAGWSLALPVLLFEDVRGTLALRRSWAATAPWRARIVLLLVVWLASSMLLSALASALVGRIGGLLAPELDDQALVLIALGATLLLSGAAGLAVQFFTDSLAPLLIVRLYRVIGGGGALTPPISDPGSLSARARFQVPSRAFVAVAALAPIAVLAGFHATVKDISVERDIAVIAHRGASSSAPENTLAAFERALEEEADFIELDVQERSDGVVIVAHDSDFMKQAGNPLKVRDATSEDLDALDIGSWFDSDEDYSDQRVPTLREVLEWASGAGIGVVIELKYYGHNEVLEQSVVELVEGSKMTDSIKIMSLKREGLRTVGLLRPDWTRGLLNTASVGDLTRLDVDFLALNSAAATAGQIRRAHEKDMQVYVWTVNDPVQMFVMLGRGADGIITDEPALAREVLEFRTELGFAGRLVLWAAGESGLLPAASEASGAGDA